MNVSFIIPTNRNQIVTLSSIPDGYPVYIQREKGDYIARNAGIKRAEDGIIICCDDDISFSHDFLTHVLSLVKPGILVGLEDYWPFRWCITRFMAFYKSDWEKVGGFDETKEWYGGPDTDFCIRMEQEGITIIRLPRDIIKHHDAEKDLPLKTKVIDNFWLWRKHPAVMTTPILSLIGRKLGLENEYK
jgi:glycosyltransferase involved in cell wall biosynthesis